MVINGKPSERIRANTRLATDGMQVMTNECKEILSATNFTPDVFLEQLPHSMSSFARSSSWYACDQEDLLRRDPPRSPDETCVNFFEKKPPPPHTCNAPGDVIGANPGTKDSGYRVFVAILFTLLYLGAYKRLIHVFSASGIFWHGQWQALALPWCLVCGSVSRR